MLRHTTFQSSIRGFSFCGDDEYLKNSNSMALNFNPLYEALVFAANSLMKALDTGSQNFNPLYEALVFAARPQRG